jgi:hypothetical protein
MISHLRDCPACLRLAQLDTLAQLQALIHEAGTV